MTLSGSVTCITGASSGIGRATALEFTRHGASVVAVGRDPERLDALAAEMRELGGNPECMTLDVRRPEDMDRMADRAVEKYGRIDALVAAAGVGGPPLKAGQLPPAVVQLSPAAWQDVIDTNLKGVFFSNRAVLRVMMKQRSGQVVNVSSSRGATMATPYAAAYGASKRGVLGMSEALAIEMRSFNIRVQCLLPDATDTPLLHGDETLAPRGKMSTDIVAGFIRSLVTLPEDVYLDAPLLAPLGKSRRR